MISTNYDHSLIGLSIRKLAVVLLLTLLGVGCMSQALAEEKEVEKAPFDPSKAEQSGLGMPSPYDKFLGLALLSEGTEIDWKSMYNAVSTDLDPDQWQDAEVDVPLALGMRIADGIMAIQARDAEFLGECATDIEKLAPLVGVSDADLQRARRVREHANAGEWLKVFMELGFLQQDILQTMQKDEKNRGDLVIASGWMQGARYTTRVILDNYSDESSNIVREPMLVAAILEKLSTQPPAVKEHPAVALINQNLPKVKELIDVAIDEPIAKRDIEQIQEMADAYATQVLQAAE